ncbi:hypothetical protein THOM_2008, partial [Trachipleistophora hominis]
VFITYFYHYNVIESSMVRCKSLQKRSLNLINHRTKYRFNFSHVLITNTKHTFLFSLKFWSLSEMERENDALTAIKEKMKDAVFRDKELNRHGKPALNRLDNLDGCIRALYSLRNDIDTETFLILKEWLEPLPDNTLPNIEIKSEILSFLLKTSVTRDQLVESEIGKIVYFYSLNNHETSEIRNLSKQLVKKWTMVAVQEQNE